MAATILNVSSDSFFTNPRKKYIFRFNHLCTFFKLENYFRILLGDQDCLIKDRLFD